MALFIVGIVGVIVFYMMHVRISDLERTVTALQQLNKPQETISPIFPNHIGQEQSPVHASAVYSPILPQPIAPLVPPPRYATMPPSESGGDSALDWLKKDFLVKLGAFLLLLALGWFVSYAFANNWIGPVGRITLGLCIGALFLGFGFWRLRTHQHQGEIFMVLGGGIILLTILAARVLYDLFTPLSALAAIFATVVVLARVAVSFRSVPLAASSLVMAAIAPFFVHTAEPSALLLLAYLAVVVIGTTWVVYEIEANILLIIALVVIYVYTLPFVAMTGVEAVQGLGFGLFFTLVFFITNLLVFLRRPEETDTRNALVAFGTGFYLILVVSLTPLLDDALKSMTYLAWAIVFSVGSFYVHQLCRSATPFYIYGSMAIGLVGIATMTLLSDDILTVVLALEIMLLTLVVLNVFRNETAAGVVSLLFIIPAGMGLMNLANFPVSSGNPFNSDTLVITVLIMCLSIVAVAFQGRAIAQMGHLLAAVAGFYGLALIWLMLHTVLPTEMATMVALFIYTSIGLVLYLYGRQESIAGLKLAGGILIGLVILRLLSVEVWEMSIAGRIVLFSVIGILFISTAFIHKKRT